MGLFKKKGGDVPEIPEAPKLPALPEVPAASEVPELPSIPASSQNDNLNQEMVKSAVGEASSEVEPAIPEAPVTPIEPPAFNDSGEANGAPMGDATDAQSPIPEPPTEEAEAPVEGPKVIEPIFVRIDKFQDAKESLSRVQDKTKEMKDILRKLNEVRRKEEEEISGWDEELEKLKSMLSEVESEIFNQV